MGTEDKAIVKAWIDAIRASLPSGGFDPLLVALRSDQADGAATAAVMDELLSARREAAAGAGGALPWYGDTRMLMRGLATEVLGRPRRDLDSDFDRVWDELLDFVKRDDAETFAIAAVRGLWLSRPELTFDEGGLFLAQLPEQLAIERWSAPDGFFDGHALGFYLRFVDRPWDAELLKPHQADAERRLILAVEQAWRALALVTPTNPVFPLPATDYVTSIGPTWLERAMGRSISAGRSGMMALNLGADGEDAWVAAYRDLGRVDWHRFAFLDLSFRRFVEACRKRTYDDRVIHFSIAAESLFLVHADTELTNRLGQRASVWLGGDAAERDQNWKDFNEIYAARSKLVHGETWRPKRSQRQLDVLASLAGEHMRRALQLAVEWCNSGRCTFPSKGLLDWDREFRNALIL
ncbi:MAG: hypothetical protein HY875_08435 [Chloroflexi bacterium]|nr:hypothetical protein [Chloroflexota bacterium]